MTVFAALLPGLIAGMIKEGISAAAAKPEVPVDSYNAQQVSREVLKEVVQTPQYEELAEKFTPKPFWQSSTMWGIGISVIFKGISFFAPDLPLPGEDATIQWISMGISLVGDVIAAKGRKNAVRPLGAKTVAPPVPPVVH
jgi:hypothetical protein